MNTHPLSHAIIEAITGDCGSRKTRTYLTRIAQSLLGLSTDVTKFIIAIPQNEVGASTMNTLYDIMAELVPNKNHRLNPLLDIRTINSTDAKMRKSVMKRLCKSVPGGSHKVYFISHETYSDISDTDMFKDWVLYHDELPSFFRVERIKFDGKMVTFGRVFTRTGSPTETFPKYAVKASVLSDTQHYGKHPDLQKLIHKYSTGRYDLHMLTKLDKDEPEEGVLVSLTMNENYFFGNTIVVGARIHDMFAGKYLADRGLLGNVTEMPSNNKNHESDKIVGSYTFHTDNSRHRRDNNQEVYAEALGVIMGEIGNQSYMSWMNANLGDDNDSLIGFDYGNATPMKHNCWGSNDFENEAIALFASSLNPHPRIRTFLEDVFGFDADMIYFNLTVMTAYQCIMRGLLRKDTPADLFNIYGFDYKLMAALKQHFFPNMKLVKLGNVAEPKRKPMGRPTSDVSKSDGIKASRMKALAKDKYEGYTPLQRMQINNAKTEDIVKMKLFQLVTSKGNMPKPKKGKK